MIHIAVYFQKEIEYNIVSRISLVLCILAIAMTSCSHFNSEKQNPTSWECAITLVREKAKAKEYSYILNYLIAPALKQMLIEKYGRSDWKQSFRKEKLESLSLYLEWLTDCKVKHAENKVYITGQHGCYATFINIDGEYLLLDFGQRITSM